MDGNTAVAHVAYRVNEVCAIFPITPSSTMAELADEWAAAGHHEHLGQRPGRPGDAERRRRRRRGARRAAVGRADDDLHGVAGPAADDPQHVQDRRRTDRRRCSTSRPARSPPRRCRSSATTPTSWRCAPTGFALLSSASVQEAHDMALIAQAATLESRVPFLHFFDGFRTSHEVNTLDLLLSDDADPRDDRRRPGARASRARARPRAARSSAARRTTPTRSSRRARRSIRSTRACPASCRRRWTASPS